MLALYQHTLQASGCATDVTEDNVDEGEVDKLVKGLVQQVSQVCHASGLLSNNVKIVLTEACVNLMHLWNGLLLCVWQGPKVDAMGPKQWLVTEQSHPALLCSGWYRRPLQEQSRQKFQNQLLGAVGQGHAGMPICGPLVRQLPAGQDLISCHCTELVSSTSHPGCHLASSTSQAVLLPAL